MSENNENIKRDYAPNVNEETSPPGGFDIDQFIKNEFAKNQNSNNQNITQNPVSSEIDVSNAAVIPNLRNIPTPTQFNYPENNGVFYIDENFKKNQFDVEGAFWAIENYPQTGRTVLSLYAKSPITFNLPTGKSIKVNSSTYSYFMPIIMGFVGFILMGTASVFSLFGLIMFLIGVRRFMQHKRYENTAIFSITLPQTQTLKDNTALVESLNENVEYMGRENIHKIAQNFCIDHQNRNSKTMDYIIKENYSKTLNNHYQQESVESVQQYTVWGPIESNQSNGAIETPTISSSNIKSSGGATMLNRQNINMPVLDQLKQDEEYEELITLVKKIDKVKGELNESDTQTYNLCLNELINNGIIYLKAKQDGIGYEKIKENFDEVTGDLLQLFYGIEGNLIEAREDQVRISNIFIKNKLGK